MKGVDKSETRRREPRKRLEYRLGVCESRHREGRKDVGEGSDNGECRTQGRTHLLQ